MMLGLDEIALQEAGIMQEAYVHGASTRKVDELVLALGMSGISKSQVSRLCKELDAEVGRFRIRDPTGSLGLGLILFHGLLAIAMDAPYSAASRTRSKDLAFRSHVDPLCRFM